MSQDPGRRLWQAAEQGVFAEARLLVKEGADVNYANAADGGTTPLINAVYHCHQDIAHLLLDHGANPNQAMENGETAWDFAAQRGDIEMCQLLLFHGARRTSEFIDPYAPLPPADRPPQPPPPTTPKPRAPPPPPPPPRPAQTPAGVPADKPAAEPSAEGEGEDAGPLLVTAFVVAAAAAGYAILRLRG